MKINLSYNVKVGTLEVHECDKKGRTKNKLVLRDLEIAGDAAGKSKASEYIAGLRLIGKTIAMGLKALRDLMSDIIKQLDADREERRERLERIREREIREAREERRESERRARKNPKGWRHVRA